MLTEVKRPTVGFKPVIFLRSAGLTSTLLLLRVRGKHFSQKVKKTELKRFVKKSFILCFEFFLFVTQTAWGSEPLTHFHQVENTHGHLNLSRVSRCVMHSGISSGKGFGFMIICRSPSLSFHFLSSDLQPAQQKISKQRLSVKKGVVPFRV